MSEDWITAREDRSALWKVLFKVTVYYAILIGIVTLSARWIPGFVEAIPVGGVSALSGAADLEISQLEDALLNGDFEESDFDAVLNPPNKETFRFDDAFGRWHRQRRHVGVDTAVRTLERKMVAAVTGESTRSLQLFCHRSSSRGSCGRFSSAGRRRRARHRFQYAGAASKRRRLST